MFIDFTTSLAAFLAAVQTVAHLAGCRSNPKSYLHALNCLQASVKGIDGDGRVTVSITKDLLRELRDQCCDRARELHDLGSMKVDGYSEFANDATSKIWAERLESLNFQINKVTTLIEQQEDEVNSWWGRTGQNPPSDAYARLDHLHEWEDELRKSAEFLHVNMKGAFL